MPDAWPYTKPELTELILKLLNGYERAASGGPYINGWLTIGAICSEMLAQHRVRLARQDVEEILVWLVDAGCVQSLPVDHGFGSLQRCRAIPGVNFGALLSAREPLDG